MLDSGHGIKVDARRDGFAVISKLDEDLVKALAGSFLESLVFFLRFFAVLWSFLLVLQVLVDLAFLSSR